MSRGVRYQSRGTIAISVGQRLRKLRKAAKMTQAQLGAALGVKPQQISKYESGIDSLGLENLGKAARLFKVTTDELMGQETGFAEGDGPVFDPAPHPPHETLQRLVAVVEDLLRQVRDLSEEPRANTRRQPLL